MWTKKNEVLEGELKNLSDILGTVQEVKDTAKVATLATAANTFKAIFGQLTAPNDHNYVQKVSTLTQSYIKECLLDIFGIVKQEDVAVTMNDVLISIIKSPVAPNVSHEVAHLVTTFLFCNFKSFPNYIHLFPFLEEFFKDPVFVPAFQQEKGPESCLNLFLDTTKTEFSQLVIDNMTPTLSLYYRDSPKLLNDFLNLVLQFITSVTTQVLHYYLTFLLNLLRGRDPKIIDGFVKDKFDKINQAIFAGRSKEMLRVYAAFTEIIDDLNFEDDQSSRLIEKLVDLIEMSKDDGEFQLHVLQLLYNFVTGFKIGIGTSDYFRLARDISGANAENVEILFEICLFAAENMPKTDKNVILGTIRAFVTLEAALTRDISTAFEVILVAKEAFTKFAMSFFTLLIKPATSEDLTNLFHKYPVLIELFPIAFRTDANSEMEITLIRIFLGTTLWETDYETFHEVLVVLFERIPSLFPFILPHVSEINEGALRALLKVVTDVAIRDSQARKFWIGNHVMVKMAALTQSGIVSVGELFDFIAGLVFPRINAGIDKEVYELLEQHNFFNASTEALKKLAFGRRQSDEEGRVKWRLALPSLLPKLDSFVIASPFDQVYCSTVGINAWAKATGRHILEFPSLDRISRRMMRPSHAKFIINSSKLMLQCIGSELDTVPVFEFPERVDNSEITIACGGIAALSLWFWLDDAPKVHQTLVTYGSVGIGLKGCNVLVGGEQAFEFRVSRWNMLVILPDGVTCNNQTYPWKMDEDVPVVVLGNRKANECDFYIGGAVRVFSAPLQQKTIDKLWRNGAKFVSTVARHHEILTLEPSETNHPGVKFGENTRIATSSPFSSFVQTAMGGSKCVFERVLSLVMEDDTERAMDLVHLLVMTKRKDIGSWSSKEFAIHMSILVNYGLIDDALSQAIFDCLVATGHPGPDVAFDWEAALTFLLDFRLLSSTTTVNNLIWFMDLSELNDTHRILVARFAFHAYRVLHIPVLMDLFKKARPPLSLVCELLAFLKSHGPNEEARQLLRYSLNSMLTKDFNEWYVLSALSDTEALEVVMVVISLLSSAADWSHIDRKRLMKECVTRCHLTKAWSGAVSLMIRVPTDVESRTVIDIDTIDVSLVPDFLVMFGILSGQIHRADPKSRWKRIFDMCMSFLKDIWEYVVVDDALVFSLIHVLGMGAYTENVCVFPFSPGLKEPDDIIEYAMQRGQPFPQASQDDKKEEPDDRNEIAKSAIIAECDQAVPHSFNAIAPYSEKVLTHTFTESEYEEMIQAIQDGSSKNFMDFCRQKVTQFEFEQPETVEERLAKLESSMLTIDIFQFIVDFLLDREENLVQYLSRLAVNSQLNHSHYTVFMLQKIIFFILHHFNTEGIYSVEFADFVCERVTEGWFSGQIAPVLALLMGTCSSAISDKVAQTLLLGFDLVPFNQFHIFTELFVSYQPIIFINRDLEFYKILLHSVWKHYEVAPETFTKILNIVARDLEAMREDAHGEMLDSVIASVRRDEFDEEQLKEFKNTCFDAHDEFERECRNVVLGSLSELAKLMQANEQFFYDQARAYGKSILEHRLVMQTTRDAVAKFTEHVHDCDIELFFRIREHTLTKLYRFDHSKGSGRALVPLTDVFLPSKRMERSPLVYKPKDMRKIIPHPYKIDKLDVLSDVNDRLTLNMQRIDTLLFSKYQVPKLRFCCEIPMHGDLDDQLFDIVISDGDPVESKHPCSFRSCIHQCALAGTVYKLADCLVFRDNAKSLAKVPKHFFMNYIASGFFGKPALYKGSPMLIWKLTDIVKVFRVSPTVFEFNLAGGQSFVLEGNLADVAAQVVNNTLPVHSPALRLTKAELSACVERWQKGALDNYNYLCYLNRLANRSFADSGRFPVFPFMFSSCDEFQLRDLSLPMGMLDEEKAKYYRDHCEVAGVHYQDGFLEEGAVVSYLAGVDPYGIFAFHSKPLDLNASLKSCTFISEMVPQWFGFTDITDGVVLPKWAKNPIHFSHRLIESLEDSENLHSWIDLIFGVKSRGDAAVEAMNVYSPDKITSEQLFRKPHEARTPVTHHEIFFNANLITTQELVPFDRPIGSLLVTEDDVIAVSPVATHVYGSVFLRIEKNRRRIVCIADDKKTTVFSDEFLRTTNSIHISSSGMFLVTSQTEGSVCVARILYNAGVPESLVDLVRFPTNAQVRQTAVSSADFLAVAICGNRLRRFCLARMREVDPIDAPEKINSVAIDEVNGVIVIGCEKSFVIYTIGGKRVWMQPCGSPVSAVHCCNVRRTLCIVTGHGDGYVLLWYYDTSMSMVVNCFAAKVLKSRVTVIAQNATTERLVVGNNEHLACIDFKGTSLPPIHKKFVVNCAKCGTKIVKRRNCCECKRHFCNKCVKSFGKKMPHLKRHICEFCAKKMPH